MFIKGLISFNRNLQKYDGDGFSYYDLVTAIKVVNHICQFDILRQVYSLSDVMVLECYGDKWTNPNMRELIHQPPPNIIVDKSWFHWVRYRTISQTYRQSMKSLLDFLQKYEDYAESYKKTFLNNIKCFLRKLQNIDHQ